MEKFVHALIKKCDSKIMHRIVASSNKNSIGDKKYCKKCLFQIQHDHLFHERITRHEKYGIK